jgi:hypothetical protein
MEGRWDDFAVGAAPPQGRYYGRRSDGGESDGSSGGVELSLRLRTGSSPPAAEQQHDATAMRSMTIFYNGRVCAVDVTEIQVIIDLMIRPLAFAARVYDRCVPACLQYTNLSVNNPNLIDRIHIYIVFLSGIYVHTAVQLESGCTVQSRLHPSLVGVCHWRLRIPIRSVHMHDMIKISDPF